MRGRKVVLDLPDILNSGSVSDLGYDLKCFEQAEQ
jgi:hypothetical protein